MPPEQDALSYTQKLPSHLAESLRTAGKPRRPALPNVFEPPPEGFATWDYYWRDFGLDEDDLGIGEDRIVDPAGHGPRIWFQIVPDGK